MKIKLTSLLVTNQERALLFYTEIIGFIKKTEIAMGDYKWLTIVSATEPDGVELLLEPISFSPARDYQSALYEAGIPATAFQVDDIEQEYQRLQILAFALVCHQHYGYSHGCCIRRYLWQSYPDLPGIIILFRLTISFVFKAVLRCIVFCFGTCAFFL